MKEWTEKIKDIVGKTNEISSIYYHVILTEHPASIAFLVVDHENRTKSGNPKTWFWAPANLTKFKSGPKKAMIKIIKFQDAEYYLNLSVRAYHLTQFSSPGYPDPNSLFSVTVDSVHCQSLISNAWKRNYMKKNEKKRYGRRDAGGVVEEGKGA